MFYNRNLEFMKNAPQEDQISETSDEEEVSSPEVSFLWETSSEDTWCTAYIITSQSQRMEDETEFEEGDEEDYRSPDCDVN